MTPMMQSKAEKLKLERVLYAKAMHLRVLTRDHFNSGRWDTEQHMKNASQLLGEIIDIANTLRNGLT